MNRRVWKYGACAVVLASAALGAACDSSQVGSGSTTISASSSTRGSTSSASTHGSTSTSGGSTSSSQSSSTSAGVDSGAFDAGPPDADASDATTDGAIDATTQDVSNGGAPEDAFSFPDAQSLAGLRIGILGNNGTYSEAMLDGYLATAATVTRIEDSADAGAALDGTTLAAFDVVILDQLIRAYTPDEAQALADWVAAGHGVLSLTGYTGAGPDGTRPSSLLANLGLAYDTSALLSNNAVSPLTPHPLMEGVTSLNFSGGWAVIAPPADGGADAGAAVVVARVDSTHAALIALDYGGGRAVAWGDEWIEYDSEFQNNQGTERFWNNAMLWLTHRK